ncbi:MAG: hypothetical protein A3G93_03175 [Nitrospinae bacterium RIFCSPLOWO2_12_FULL_45_22]|nr:MAG: hypothetical protein A3G93_03175 [Nitrospinae bacterium RIFCSPLOWO2_12_FULL_45_22]
MGSSPLVTVHGGQGSVARQAHYTRKGLNINIPNYRGNVYNESIQATRAGHATSLLNNDHSLEE